MPFYKHGKRNIQRSKMLEKITHKNGLRHAIFNTVGDKYVGEWKENEKSGKGVLFTVKNKELYEGDFVNNIRHGFGVLAYQLPNLNVFSLLYRGDWKNGKMHGNGLRIYIDGGFYVGEWRNGKRHGYGHMWYGDGFYYDGDWVDGMKEGAGLLVRDDGNRFEGSWFRDMKHGKGRYYFVNCGQLQEGIWHNDSCIFSTICNLPFRQAALNPMIYPLQKLRLLNADQICENQESRALAGLGEICHDTVIEEDDNLSKFSVEFVQKKIYGNYSI